MTMSLMLSNSLGKKKETFSPLIPGHVGLYVCGITPYDYAHLGHGRCYVSFDVLVRLLKLLEYNVTYVRNFTDIDDKILAKAAQHNPALPYTAISEKFIAAFHEDMASLNCQAPTIEPTVTGHIQEIITFIEGLIASGNAYVVDSDVYFAISTFPEYGALSGRKLEDLQAGSRVEIDTRKRHPGDFALWKGSKEGTFWQTPWGNGRPGWHIECSAMAYKYLGSTIDIHAGGMDLLFPHHENEVAQSECLTKKPFARYWLHNAFININKEKMSKSLGNFITLKEAFKQKDPMILRYYYLQHQYRTPLDFNPEELAAVTVAYKKLITLGVESDSKDPDYTTNLAGLQGSPVASKLLSALCDDLNTPKFLGIIFENYNQIKNDSLLCLQIVFILRNILGLLLKPLNETESALTTEIIQLIKEREEARANKNWSLADKIRDQLSALGHISSDKKI